MKRPIVLLVTCLLAGGAYLHYRSPSHSETDTERAMDQIADVTSGVFETAEETARKLSDSIREQIDKWDLDTQSIKDELADTGEIVRENIDVISDVVKESSGDAILTSKIKAKLGFNREIAARKINVDTDDGEVTLTGTVKTEQQIAEAVALALDQEGVKKVTARLKVEP